MQINYKKHVHLNQYKFINAKEKEDTYDMTTKQDEKEGENKKNKRMSRGRERPASHA